MVTHFVVFEVKLNDSQLLQLVFDMKTFFLQTIQSISDSTPGGLYSRVGKPKECCWSVVQPQHLLVPEITEIVVKRF